MQKESKPLTGCTLTNHISDSLGERLIRFLAERCLAEEGLTASITPRQRNEGETETVILRNHAQDAAG